MEGGRKGEEEGKRGREGRKGKEEEKGGRERMSGMRLPPVQSGTSLDMREVIRESMVDGGGKTQDNLNLESQTSLNETKEEEVETEE